MRALVIAGAVLTADLVLKKWAFDHVAGQPVFLGPHTLRHPDLIPPHESIRLIPHVLHMTLTVNDGAVFGLGSGSRIPLIAFGVTAILLISMIFWRARQARFIVHLAIALVLAGAVGNLYDRIRYGVVRDMLLMFPDTPLPFGWSWPDGSRGVFPWIFNIADVALDVGVVLLILTLMRSKPSSADSIQEFPTTKRSST